MAEVNLNNGSDNPKPKNTQATDPNSLNSKFQQNDNNTGIDNTYDPNLNTYINQQNSDDNFSEPKLLENRQIEELTVFSESQQYANTILPETFESISIFKPE